MSVLDKYRLRYTGFGPTFASEKLREQGHDVDHETLRRWLIEDGQWFKRRKRALHRGWRERKAHFGELVQMDGSPHRWFGLAHPAACLMNMVDDARGVTLARMSEEETTESAMRVLWRWIERYGIPQALYTDRKSVYITEREPTVEEQLAGTIPLTAFGKACQRLSITIIAAHSPQAKGRVERNHGVYQDRLVKELALQGITTIEGANALLDNGFVDGLNARFARPAAHETDFHRPVPDRMNLADIFCWEQERAVQNDWTLRHANRRYQIEKSSRPLPRPKDKAVVRTRLDGSIALLYRGAPLDYHILPLQALQTPPKAPPAKPAPAGQPGHGKGCKGRNRSPWRQGCMMMASDVDNELLP
jgi:hypothetical protein